MKWKRFFGFQLKVNQVDTLTIKIESKMFDVRNKLRFLNFIWWSRRLIYSIIRDMFPELFSTFYISVNKVLAKENPFELKFSLLIIFYDI